MASQNDDPGNLIEQARDKARGSSDRLKGVVETAQEAAGEVANKAGDYGQQAVSKARELMPFLQRSLKEQPLATLAGVAAVGFVLGAIARR